MFQTVGAFVRVVQLSSSRFEAFALVDLLFAGLPLFEDAGYRTFDEFCSHWKENHRILVQRRMLWHVAASRAFDDPTGVARSAVDMAPAGYEYDAPSASSRVKKGGKHSRKGRRSSAEEMGNLSARLNAELHDAETKGRSDVGGIPATPESKVKGSFCSHAACVATCQSRDFDCAEKQSGGR